MQYVISCARLLIWHGVFQPQLTGSTLYFRTLFFLLQIVFHCTDILHFAYPFPSQWTCELFPLFSYYEYFMCKSLCRQEFPIPWVETQEQKIAGDINVFNFFFKLAKLFSKVAAPFYIPSSNQWRVQISLNTHQ